MSRKNPITGNSNNDRVITKHFVDGQEFAQQEFATPQYYSAVVVSFAKATKNTENTTIYL